ncbi:MAG: hypothetical protein P1T08_10035 [Acidimicrobiia bacterium]|nr:hypothetical protein [Acidimicrobiia bacterium]
MRLDGIAKEFSDRVRFLCVYIKEAHPTDGAQASANLDDGVLFAQPLTEDERAGVAAACRLRYSYSFPMVLDDMEDTVGDAYMAWPGRLYLLDNAGRVVWRCGLGPHFFDPIGFESAIREHIAALATS